MKKSFLLGILLGLIFNLNGQSNACLEVDTNVLLIGDQVRLTATLITKEKTDAFFPEIDPSCLPVGVEILSKGNVDTTFDAQTKEYKLSQTYIITSFDSGEYFIPALVLFGWDSTVLAATNPLTLIVGTVAVDTTSEICDIKSPLDAPITFSEILPYLLAGAAVAALIVGLIFIVRYLKRRNSVGTPIFAKPQAPAHEIALTALQILWNQKLVEQGRKKEYYTQLSDILRTYIANSWRINAMEMVSSDIIESLGSVLRTEGVIKRLEMILFCADMVKFAKSSPPADVSSLHYKYATEFVEATKIIENQTETTNNN